MKGGKLSREKQVEDIKARKKKADGVSLSLGPGYFVYGTKKMLDNTVV